MKTFNSCAHNWKFPHFLWVIYNTCSLTMYECVRSHAFHQNRIVDFSLYYIHALKYSVCCKLQNQTRLIYWLIRVVLLSLFVFSAFVIRCLLLIIRLAGLCWLSRCSRTAADAAAADANSCWCWSMLHSELDSHYVDCWTIKLTVCSSTQLLTCYSVLCLHCLKLRFEINVWPLPRLQSVGQYLIPVNILLVSN